MKTDKEKVDTPNRLAKARILAVIENVFYTDDLHCQQNGRYKGYIGTIKVSMSEQEYDEFLRHLHKHVDALYKKFDR